MDNLPRQQVYLKDLRLTFQSGTIGGYSYLRTLAKTEDVLIKEGETDIVFPFYKCKFYIGNTPLNEIVRPEDILKYKINQQYDLHTNEIYYNACRGIAVNANTFKMQYEDGALLYEFPVTDLAVGQRIYKNGKEYIIKSNFYTDGNSTNLITESYIGGSSYKKEIYDEHLDIMRSIVDGVTTYYERNVKGLVTKEQIIGLYRYDTTYTDNLITVSEVEEVPIEDLYDLEEVIISQKKYYLDTTWGCIDKVEILDGDGNILSTVDNTYDGDSTLMGISFGGNLARNNIFGYTNGRLSSLTSGALNYTFGYSDKGEITSVSKNENEIASIEYGENADGSTVNTHYNSHSELQEFDKHGRLTELVGVLRNTYDASPTYSTSGGYVMLGKDNISAKLAKTEDFITNQTTKYAYEQDCLSRVGTIEANAVIKEETFEYDDANRLTKDTCVYDVPNSKSVASVIQYEKDATDPSADNAINSYSYKINNVTKATTTNEYDAYKRVTKKTSAFDIKPFVKDITYDKNRVNEIKDSHETQNLGTNTYDYDGMGRIISNTYSSDYAANYNNTYEYDNYGQLTTEINNALDKTFQYEYNGIGNLKSVTTNGVTTSSFTYGNTSHPDRLTKFGSKTIDYNSMGCPITYGSKKLDWNNGMLSKYYDEEDPAGFLSSERVEFTYNAQGQRTYKEYVYYPGVDYSGDFLISTTSEYDYDHSGRLIRELNTEYYTESACQTKEFIFLYDESGMIGFTYSNNGATPITRYYHKNLQGDVIAIYSSSGSKLAEYRYDAYGNHTIVADTLENRLLAKANPIRYRGYYYDNETGFYYLNSRYYNPEWRRFISPANASALNPQTVNGLNLYSYAHNNPINTSYSIRTVDSQFNSMAQCEYNGYESLINTSYTNQISNLFGALYTLSNVFGAFDQWSGYLNSALESGLKYWGPHGVGIHSLGKYSNVISKFGTGMLIAGSVLSWGSSVYNNFTNTNYTTTESFLASTIDGAYFAGKGIGTNWIGLQAGKVAIDVGIATSGAAVYYLGLGYFGAFVVGGSVAFTVAAASAVAIYYLGEGIDWLYEEFKKLLFER